MITTKASIVIPTFNRAAYLKEAIDAALAQTVPCEVIVCDHGSTDNTPEVAGSYGSKITYIRKEKDFGVHFCWLEAVIHASNEWVHLNYDDDWIAPAYIEECLQYAQDPEVAFIFCQANIYNDKTRTSVDTFQFLNFGTGIHPIRKVEKLLFQGVISPACVLIRKKDMLNGLMVGEVPLSRGNYRGVGPDILVTLLSLLEYKKFAYSDKPLAYFRAHEGSITIDSTSNQLKVQKIAYAYDEAKKYYVILKLVRKSKLKDFLFYLYSLYNRIINKLLK